MLGKNKIKLIRSLEYKKYRQAENLFIAEGDKLVSDLLNSDFEIEMLIGTDEFLSSLTTVPRVSGSVIATTADEIRKASLLKHPQHSMAVCRIPSYEIPGDMTENRVVLSLDGIQDPGNLGTIVRLAAWFGIEHMICSTGTVDIYSPKAVQATMGAISQIKIHYTDLILFLTSESGKGTDITGTFPEGENIYTAGLPGTGIIVLGNEGSGIRPELHACFTKKISIPDFAGGRSKPESLNVSMAAAIVLSEYRRSIWSGVHSG